MSTPVNLPNQEESRVSCPVCKVYCEPTEYRQFNQWPTCDTCFTQSHSFNELRAAYVGATCLHCPNPVDYDNDDETDMCEPCYNKRHCAECDDCFEPEQLDEKGECDECRDYNYQCSICNRDFDSREEKKIRKLCPDCEPVLFKVKPLPEPMEEESFDSGYDDWDEDKPASTFCYECLNDNDIDADEPGHVCPHDTVVDATCQECLVSDKVTLKYGRTEMLEVHVCISCKDMLADQQKQRDQLEARLREQIQQNRIEKSVLKPKLLDRKPKVIKSKAKPKTTKPKVIKSKYATPAIVIE